VHIEHHVKSNLFIHGEADDKWFQALSLDRIAFIIVKGMFEYHEFNC
jgi:hypothetical protein